MNRDRYTLFFLIWGPSGCGKDYFVNKISQAYITLENEKDNINPMDTDWPTIPFWKPVQYTDRPMRKNESQNNPYVFCTVDTNANITNFPNWDIEIDRLKKEGSLLSVTQFNTVNGLFRYALSYENPFSDKDYIMATSYFQLLDIFKWKFENRDKESVKNTLLWPIFVETDTSERLIRLYNREMDKDESDRNFQEIVRRFVESDSVDYSYDARKSISALFSKELKEMNIDVKNAEDFNIISNNYDRSSYNTLVQKINIVYDTFSHISETD